MSGILQLDLVCLTEIFKFLTPLDLCSVRQSCTQLQHFVDDHFHLLYFVQKQWLDLKAQDIRNVDKILQNFGRFVRHLKVGNLNMEPDLLLDVIANNCGNTLKGLSLNDVNFFVNLGYGSFKKALVRFTETFTSALEKCTGVFDDLEVLELNYCGGHVMYFETLLRQEYRNLTTLRLKYSEGSGTVVDLNLFLMRKRNIKILHCCWINDSIFPLIAENAPEIEELEIWLDQEKNERNMMSLSSLSKLRRLEMYSEGRDHRTYISLIKELSVNTKLEIVGLYNFKFTDECCGAISNLTNLKELRLNGHFAVNDTKSIEMLGRKLTNLESLVLQDVIDFPYRNFLACRSDKLRTIYIRDTDQREINNFTQQMVNDGKQMVNDFIDGIGHRCFVSGYPLCIYLAHEMYEDIAELLTQDNLQSVQRFGNIKILQANSDNVFNELLIRKPVRF